MCIIIDANVAGRVFCANPDDDFKPVFDWLLDPAKNGRLVYGGQLRKELDRVSAARGYLVEFLRAGRAILIPDGVVGREEKALLGSRLCVSDDPHVVALARLGGARTLCSHDKVLHRDFTNPRLVSKPRGRIYQTAQHAHLLRHTAACRQSRKPKQKSRSRKR